MHLIYDNDDGFMLYIGYDEEGLPKFGHGISHPGVEFEG
jgi:hypothetical protein